MDDRRKQKGGHLLPSRSGSNLARNTLKSARIPDFTFLSYSRENNSSTKSLRVPNPIGSDEKAVHSNGTEASKGHLPAYSNATSPGLNFPTYQRDRLSELGDFSSLFSSTSASPAASAHADGKEPFQLSRSGPTATRRFELDSPLPTEMVVEREPPKATPQKPAKPAMFNSHHQSEFGKPSPLQSKVQQSTLFNIPKSINARPEHHRDVTSNEHSKIQLVKDTVPRFIQPSQPQHPQSLYANADVVEIPRPVNAPSWNTHPRPPPTFSSFNPSVGGFVPVNTSQKPFIDLTKPQDTSKTDGVLFDDHFGTTDPYLYLDSGKATENIKALLEGAFEDEDKPKIRRRKKKAEAAVTSLSDDLQKLEMKPHNQREDHDYEEEEEDDGIVEGLVVKLLPHQVDGVEWMREKEAGVKKKNGIIPKGGILADDVCFLTLLRKSLLIAHRWALVKLSNQLLFYLPTLGLGHHLTYPWWTRKLFPPVLERTPSW